LQFFILFIAYSSLIIYVRNILNPNLNSEQCVLTELFAADMTFRKL